MPIVPIPHLRQSALFTFLTLSQLITGCTSTTVTFHATGIETPLCKDKAQEVKSAIYWGTAWRPDQKEVSRREAIIAKGVEDFFRITPCFSIQTISRTIDGRDVLLLNDKEVLASVSPDTGRIHILRFEELGPVLQFYLSPILWTSDLNIQVRIRTLNAHTGSLESDVIANWRKGGPFNLRGVNGLPPDLTELLQSVFIGSRAP
jgi:hypothetical protein